jgi:hypothetical protein
MGPGEFAAFAWLTPDRPSRWPHREYIIVSRRCSLQLPEFQGRSCYKDQSSPPLPHFPGYSQVRLSKLQHPWLRRLDPAIVRWWWTNHAPHSAGSRPAGTHGVRRSVRSRAEPERPESHLHRRIRYAHGSSRRVARAPPRLVLSPTFTPLVAARGAHDDLTSLSNASFNVFVREMHGNFLAILSCLTTSFRVSMLN